MAKDPTPRDLALTKLAGSGLDAKDLKLLGMEVLDAKAVRSLDPKFKPVPGLKIPYHLPDGKLRPFYRLRYLALPPSVFGESPEKPIRYVQPPSTGTAAYFPRNVRWNGSLQDPRQALYFTEGELKAACACKQGFLTIGLGGVFNFQSAKAGVPFLPELEAIAWKGRVVYVVFDSDYREKPMVLLALERFVRLLTSHGAVPRVVNLPKLQADDPNAKTGLDDFLVAQGREEFEQLVAETTDTPVARTLWDWNDRFAYIVQPGGLVVDRTTGLLHGAQQFEQQDFRHHRLTLTTTTAEGEPRFKEVKVPTLWLDWPHRTQLESVLYAPGEPRVTKGRWNLWQGWGVEPKAGDVRPWKKLLAHVLRGCSPTEVAWFERWCAYPIQHPGTKLYTAVVLWGDQHGTGKSLVGYSLGRIYGRNFSAIGQEDLEASFNTWAHAKQFVLGDDVTGHDNRAYADKLKRMITRLDLTINEKFKPQYDIQDCINYLFTSNQSNAFYVEDHDRRYFVVHVDVEPIAEAFARDYDAWYRSEAGAAALHHHLKTLPLGNFNPNAPALLTAAKQAAIEESKSDLGVWVLELKRGGSTLLPDLVTARQVLSEYERTTGRSAANVSVNGLARELRKVGVGYFYGGQPIRTEVGQARYYVIRNHEAWAKRSPDEARKYLEQQQVKDSPKQRKKY